jgi:DNA-binding MarR family transcriptional regulator
MAKATKKQAASRTARVSGGAAKQPPMKRPSVKGASVKRPWVKRPVLGPIGKLEDFIPYKLSVVANRVSQSIGRLFETQFNIQVPEWRILMTLYAYDHLVFNEVVERTSMDKARVSRAQRRLVDLGLIDSVNDPTDGRKVILSLTRKGEKMCRLILPEAAKREAWYLAVLDEQEHRKLDVILDKLMKRSQEA